MAATKKSPATTGAHTLRHASDMRFIAALGFIAALPGFITGELYQATLGDERAGRSRLA